MPPAFDALAKKKKKELHLADEVNGNQLMYSRKRNKGNKEDEKRRKLDGTIRGKFIEPLIGLFCSKLFSFFCFLPRSSSD